MNIETIKNRVRLEDYLLSIGLSPVKRYGPYLWYNSPLRKDSNPSFLVNTHLQLWNDVGSGAGGDIIDLVRKLFSKDVKDSIEHLTEYINGNFPNLDFGNLAKQIDSDDTDQHANIIYDLQPIEHPALIAYISRRLISYSIAALYCDQITYRYQNKQGFGLSFANDRGGYVVRNKYVKFNIGHAASTLINGQNNRVLDVFEGFFDFLSYMVLNNSDLPENDTLVLNSTVFINKNLNRFKEYEKLNLFLDNDEEGERATKQICQAFSNATDRSEMYDGFKDLNDYIVNRNK